MLGSKPSALPAWLIPCMKIPSLHIQGNWGMTIAASGVEAILCIFSIPRRI